GSVALPMSATVVDRVGAREDTLPGLSTSPSDGEALSARESGDDLVFVLGPHRSGTSILHYALADTGRFAFLTAADICREQRATIDPDRYLTQHGIVDRLVDGLAVDATTPEEYGFLLRSRSVRATNVRRFERILSLLRARATSEQLVLLKNPWDFGN